MTIKPKKKEKIKAGSEGQKINCDQYPAFSFRYLTSNSTYNFDYFSTSQTVEKEKALAELSKRVSEITCNTWLYWGSRGKKIGHESMQYSNLNFTSSSLPEDFTKDQKVYIFQFSNHSYRIIGVKLGYCPMFYVIGFDFNFSAYDHE